MQQFISDMENLHRQTKDDNFSIIIVDFESEDMDVEQALRESSVPRSVCNTISHVILLNIHLKQFNDLQLTLCIYLYILTDMNILGEKGTLSAQQDCRSEWTPLRLEKQTHRGKTAICELAEKKTLTEGQTLTLTI